LLPPNKDLRLSTAAVMGARFPYISPAGRIDHTDNGINKSSYFVDGGYFDNSGAGVVHEMIIGIQEIIKKLKKNKQGQYGHLDSLQFYIIHITNSPSTDPELEKVHPLQNDLMAPISTLAGSYGTQTDVNNTRLQTYLQLLYPDTAHYRTAELYFGINRDTLSFPMNWTISNYYRKEMNNQLRNHRIVDLVNWVQQKLE
jgi:hypothetical protein